jgi:tetratricopeptide (TPR) repeat protein
VCRHNSFGQTAVAKIDHGCFLEKSPYDIEVYKYKGIAHNGHKSFEAAIESFDKYLKIYPQDAIVYRHQGIALNALKKFVEAIPSTNTLNAPQMILKPSFSKGMLSMLLGDMMKQCSVLRKTPNSMIPRHHRAALMFHHQEFSTTHQVCFLATVNPLRWSRI